MSPILRVARWLLLGTFVLVVIAVVSALVYLRSDHAREQLVAFAVRKASPLLAGELQIARSEGALTSGIVLYDLTIADLDQRPAVRVARLELRYSLSALLAARLQLDSLSVRGLDVISQPLSDGRDNLSTLIVKTKTSRPDKLPLSILLNHLEGDVHFSRPSTNIDLRARFRARAYLSQALTASLDGVVVDLEDPVRARLVAAAYVHRDRVEVPYVSVVAPLASASARGRYAFDGTGRARVHASASDLSRLAALGAPSLAGAVTLDCDLQRDAKHVTIKAGATMTALRVSSLRVRRARLSIDTVDLQGDALVALDEVALGDIRLRSARIAAQGSSKQATLSAVAKGPEGIDLDLALVGVPRLYDGHLLGLEATLQRAHLRAGGTPWDALHPAHLSADFATKMFGLSRLVLANGDQRITIEGHVMGSTIEGITVDVQHFDLKELVALVSPGHVLPHTDVSAQIEAHGPFDEPEISASFKGDADGKGKDDLVHVSAAGDARWARGRLAGKVFATIGGQDASAKVDLPWPLAPNQPLALSFDVSVLLSPWFADLLVPKLIQSQPIILYSLGTRVTAQGSVSGTTSAPQLNAKARLVRWGAYDSHGDVGVSIEYKDKKLSTSATLEISSLPAGGGSGGGLVQASAVLPIDLARVLSGDGALRLDENAPWHGELKLAHVGIEHLPFRAFAVVPPIQHGWIDASAELAGSMNHPKVSASVRGRNLDYRGLNGLDVDGIVQLAGTATTADLAISLHGSELFRLSGTLGRFDTTKPRAWRRAPIAATLKTSAFDLGRIGLIDGLKGTLDVAATLKGSLDHLSADAQLRVALLSLGATTYDRFTLTATVDEHVLGSELVVEQRPDAYLRANVRVPLAGGALVGTLQAKQFAFEVASDILPSLRLLRGEIYGALRLAGTLKQPRLDGTIGVTHGGFAVASTSLAYREVSADLVFAGSTVTAKSLSLKIGSDGDVRGNALLTMNRFRPRTLSGTFSVRQFPFERQGVVALVDTDLELVGSRATDDTFYSRLTLAHASATIREVQDVSLLTTKTLEDVRLIGLRPEPISHLLVDVPTTKESEWLTARLDGPMRVRGVDLDVTMRGDVVVVLGAKRLRARGTVNLDPGGEVGLAGRRYQIERARFVFVADKDASVDLRVGRDERGARIGVDLSGTEGAPTTSFWSKPPLYDAAAVAAMMKGEGPSTDIGTSLLARLRGR